MLVDNTLPPFFKYHAGALAITDQVHPPEIMHDGFHDRWRRGEVIHSLRMLSPGFFFFIKMFREILKGFGFVEITCQAAIYMRGEFLPLVRLGLSAP